MEHAIVAKPGHAKMEVATSGGDHAFNGAQAVLLLSIRIFLECMRLHCLSSAWSGTFRGVPCVWSFSCNAHY
jgi:hypothetical protein